MSVTVQGQFFLDMLVNGVSFPFTQDGISVFYLTESTIMGLPAFKLEYEDKTGYLADSFPITDGTPVTFIIGTESQKQQINFRNFGKPLTVPGATKSKISMVGYLDVPNYLYSVYFGGFTGTSNEALRDIAEKSYMQFDGESTQDKQTWISGNKSFSNFANHIASHGWVNDKSCMSIGVKFDKTLMYKNLTSIVSKTPRFRIHSGPPPKTSATTSFECLYYSMKSLSGVLNKFGGYDTHVAQEQMDGTFSEETRVKATKLSNYFDLDKNVKSRVGVVNSIYVPPSCGNTNDYYEKGLLQNTRMRSLYSSMIDVILDKVTGIELFDLVEFSLPNPSQDSLNRSYSGTYIVSAKMMTIHGNRYFEKIRLSSTGLMDTVGGTI